MSDRLFEEWRSTGADEQVKYLDWLEERVERVEASLADAQAENEVLRTQIAEAWSAHGEAQKRLARQALTVQQRQESWHEMRDQLAGKDERIRELEQLFKNACATVDDMETRDPNKRIADFEAALNELNSYDAPAEVVALRQQLKTANERLAHAERILRDSIDDGYRREWATGYFAKHSPSSAEDKS